MSTARRPLRRHAAPRSQPSGATRESPWPRAIDTVAIRDPPRAKAPNTPERSTQKRPTTTHHFLSIPPVRRPPSLPAFASVPVSSRRPPWTASSSPSASTAAAAEKRGQLSRRRSDSGSGSGVGSRICAEPSRAALPARPPPRSRAGQIPTPEVNRFVRIVPARSVRAYREQEISLFVRLLASRPAFAGQLL
uniref:Uncharacterized protein n=1 Tax=Setaria italica TaxID=4555 RepID=K4AI64_SETIT